MEKHAKIAEKWPNLKKIEHIWKRQRQASLKNSNFAILGQIQGDFVVVQTNKKMTDFLFLANFVKKLLNKNCKF